jgi:4-amino-4-deoxy-L-arabinose transferase-like glycosyltransferase
VNTQESSSTIPSPLRNRRWLWVLLVAIAIGAVYFANVHRNPPGYYIDESSISYNAHTISQTGRDEFGQPWPLYFRAFGDYKNPVYIYLLAGIYRITGPSIAAARLLSAACGFLAALGIGLLAKRISNLPDSREVGLLVALMALLTPWIFEISRVVLEVALYPLVIVLFLLCAHHASTKARWSWREVTCLAATLALVTYTYSIGRLVGPLFALGLILFAARGRRLGVVATWALYALSLLPLIIFQRRHPGALSARFALISYLEPPYLIADNAWEFVKHYFGNLNPLRLLVTGDPNVEQIAHIHGAPLLLAATGILAVMGLFLIIRQQRNQTWWRFVLFCLLVSIVPASLTKEYVHMLRLAPLPVFILVLTIPAITWLRMKTGRPRAILAVLVFLMFLQGAAFFWKFESSASSPKRLRQFDNGYPSQILERALNTTQRPVYLADALAIPGYIQAYWYATLRGESPANFVRLAPDQPAPDGALVITTEENCPRCRIIATSEFYTLYVTSLPAVKREPLPDAAFRARLSLAKPIPLLRAGEHYDLGILVTNESNIVWPARERSGGTFQVSAGNHWLDQSGNILVNDDGRAALLGDLPLGQQVELKLTVNAPKKAGSYLLEVDMLQEGVSWFGLKGSPTMRLPVRVE